MIHLTRSLVRTWLESLLHTHHSPQRTAAACAEGAFPSLSPFVGLHTALALVVAFVCRLNRVAVILGSCTNLPWFMTPDCTRTTVAASGVAERRYLSRHGHAHRHRPEAS